MMLQSRFAFLYSFSRGPKEFERKLSHLFGDRFQLWQLSSGAGRVNRRRAMLR